MVYDLRSSYYVIIPYICMIFLLIKRSSKFFILFSENFILFSENFSIDCLELLPDFFGWKRSLAICKIVSRNNTRCFCYVIDVFIKLCVCSKSKVFFYFPFLFNHILNNWGKNLDIFCIHIIIEIRIPRLIGVE